MAFGHDAEQFARGQRHEVEAGLIEYIGFPEALVGKYQSFTEADLTRLRSTGCDHAFANVATGVAAYVDWLARQPG